MRVTTPIENNRHFPTPSSAHVEKNVIVWIVLVVILPVILVLVLCLIAALLYRYRRRRGRNYSSTVTIDEYHPAIATIFPISQRNVFVREDLPPPYELISERKATVSSIEANHQ